MLHRFKTIHLGFKTIKKTLLKSLLTIIFPLLQVNATSVYADSGDTINFLVGSDYRHYDNLFLLPDGKSPGGSAERSDNVLRNNLIIKVDKKYSLQEFKFDFTHLESKYDNADFLNFKANNYKAVWLWAITPSLKGNLSSERNVNLIPFTDRDRDTNRKNIRTLNLQMFDFDFSPHNVWHLLGGYTQLESINSQTFLQETSFNLHAAEVGVKYSFPSDSFVAIKLRKKEGENQDVNLVSVVGKGFSENEAELSSLWKLSAKSKVAASLGHNEHTDDTFTLRDYSGYFGSIIYAWEPTAKINIGVNLYRSLSSFQDDYSSYTVNDVLSINPTWAMTPKLNIGAYALVSKRKFKGDGPFSSVGIPSRVDDGYRYGIEANWKPRSFVKLGVNLQHDERNSNDVVQNRDFSSNTIGVNGQLIF